VRYKKSMERPLFALFALLLNALLGGPRGLYEAAGLTQISRLPARFLRGYDQKLACKDASQHVFAACAILITAIMAGLICDRLLSMTAIGYAVGLVLLAILLPVRQSWDLAWDVRSNLQKNNLQGARLVLENVVRHHAILDEHGVARAAIEWLAVQFAEKILAVVMVFLIAGWSGVFVLKLVGLMQETQVSYAVEKTMGRMFHQVFYGWPQMLSSWLATVLWVMAGLFLPGFDMQRVSQALNDQYLQLNFRSRTLKTAAAVLKLSLGGPVSVYENTGWLGGGNAKPGVPDVARALFVFALLNLFLFILLGLFFG
jgi:adenosylcobinamide-phosphate synthase